MEEKKLTDEQIINALNSVGKETLAFAYDKEKRRFDYVTAKEILDLIHRLQGEKKELQESADLFNHFNEKLNGVIAEQKVEIERLTAKDNEKNEHSPFLMCEDYDAYLESMSKTELLEYFHFVMGNYKHALDEAALENDELQKQVDEQDKEIDRLEKVVHVQAEQYYDCKEKAVKDTAKEIFGKVVDLDVIYGDDFRLFLDNFELWAKERYGLEVE